LGYVKVFRRTFKNESDRYYIMYLPDLDVTKQGSCGVVVISEANQKSKLIVLHESYRN